MNRVLVSFLIVAALLVPSVVSAADVHYFPYEAYLSPNSSLGMKVVPDTYQKPYRITWSVVGIGSRGIGSFNIMDGKGYCYFSNEDENASCGPSPFTETGEHQILINVVTPSGVINMSDTINISNVFVSTGLTNLVDNTLKIKAEVFEGQYRQADYSVSYAVLDREFNALTSYKPVSYDENRSLYMGEHTFQSSGEYYVMIRACDGSCSSVSGSAMLRYYIPSTDYLEISPERSEYWTGEPVNITGNTNGDSVTGEILFPNKTKAAGFSASPKSDGSFSADVRTSSGWPEGNYTVRTSYPLEKTSSFFLSDLIESSPSSVSEKIDKSTDFSRILTIRNLRDLDLNLSLSVSGAVRASEVSLSRTSLSGLETADLSISIQSVDSNIAGTVTVKAGDVSLGIPVSIIVDETAECPPCEPSAGNLQVKTSLGEKMWNIECLEEEEISLSVKLRNKGSSEMSGFSYSIGGNLEYIEDAFDIDLSDLSIEAGDTEDVSFSFTPRYSTSGSITFQSGSESDQVYLNVGCHPDITQEISDAQNSLDLIQDRISSNLYAEISDLISGASSDQYGGDYAEAGIKLAQAGALIDAAESGSITPTPPGPGFDLTWLIIIIVILILVVGIVLFMRKRKASASSGYGEEAYSEPGYEEEY